VADGYNEGRALDAVLRFIDARDHALRENDGRSPDDLDDPDKQRRVDYVCTVGQTLYAFEHTGIEPFPNQIRLADHSQKLFGPIIERFDHRTDQETWALYVPADASAGLSGGRSCRSAERPYQMDQGECCAHSDRAALRTARQPASGGIRRWRSVSVFAA
jgi:hypothetical protein